MSYKSEFTEVYNYLSNLCKDPDAFTTDKALFSWEGDNIIYKYNSMDLSTVKVPKHVIELGCFTSESPWSYVPYDKTLKTQDFTGCFENHRELISIDIPSSVQCFSFATFYNCENLKSINIPDSVRIIGNYVFAGCSNLQELVIPEGVEVIGEGAFQSCTNLSFLRIPRSIKSSLYFSMFYEFAGELSIPEDASVVDDLTSHSICEFTVSYY